MMITPEKTLLFASKFFRKELKGLYNSSELEQLLSITFFHYFKLKRIDLTLKKDLQFSESDFQKISIVVEELKKQRPLAQIP